jgi:hypothetical protein
MICRRVSAYSDFMLHKKRVTYKYFIILRKFLLMLYFKHSQLAEDYKVSLKTVHNWIDAAKQEKLDLQLYEEKSRVYVANTPANIIMLEKLADKGKKYRNSLHHKTVTPKSEFYDLYTSRQILDIISNLNIHREVPRQYNYMDGGADNWDSWLKRLESESTSNILKGTIKLMNDNLVPLDQLIEGNRKINVIDVGVGNAAPVKELLGHLIGKNLLSRYIAIDISESMLKIAERNIEQWFNGKVKFEGHIKDISYERFDDLLIEDMLSDHSESTINLVLLLGGTPTNFRNPSDVLRVVYGSMGDRDLLMVTDKADTENSRRYFDFGNGRGNLRLSASHRFILDLMNIDESLYDVEMGFNEAKHMRYIRVRLKAALTINFKFEDSERSVNFEKGDTILLLRVWHRPLLRLVSDFEEVGFRLLHANLTRDREYLLTISGVDKEDAGEA